MYIQRDIENSKCFRCRFAPFCRRLKVINSALSKLDTVSLGRLLISLRFSPKKRRACCRIQVSKPLRVSSSVRPEVREGGMSDSRIRANIGTSTHKYARAHRFVSSACTAKDDRLLCFVKTSTTRGIGSTRYFPSQIPGSQTNVVTNDCPTKWEHMR